MKKLILLLVFILFVSNVYSLGITPGSKTFNFEQKLEKEFKIYIVNDEHISMELDISADGDLSQYVNILNNKLNFNPEDESKEVIINLKLPKEISKPGTHVIKIKVVQSDVQVEQNGVLINADVAVISLLNILVPYPGKYVEFSLDANSYNNKTILIVPVQNKGEEDIKSAKAEINIYTLDNKFVKNYQTNDLTIKSKNKRELTSVIEESMDPGVYLGKVILTYDGRKENVENKITIGSSLMELIGIYVNSFVLGQIAKFDMIVQNMWNKDISNVFGEVILYDASGSEMANLKTPSETIQSLSKKVLSAFWDSKGVDEGTYSGKAILNYDNKTTEKMLKTYITLNSIKTDIIGTGLVISDSERAKINKENVLKVLVVLLILGNLVWFLYFRKKFNQKKAL